MKDYAKELGCLGFTMRLKRLSDALMHDGKRMYKTLGLDIEPNWYIVFRLLKHENSMSVTEIAERIGMAHPSVIALTNNMTRAGYLSSVQCARDSRRRLLKLTDKAYKMMPRFEEVWNAGEVVIVQLLEDTKLLAHVEVLENRLLERGFSARTIDHLTIDK